MTIHFRCERSFSDAIRVFAFVRQADHSVVLCRLQTAEPIAEGDCWPDEPTIRMTRDQAQELMDQLWYVGLRPSEGSGSAGSLAATQRHLEDMRRLVFKEQQ